MSLQPVRLSDWHGYGDHPLVLESWHNHDVLIDHGRVVHAERDSIGSGPQLGPHLVQGAVLRPGIGHHRLVDLVSGAAGGAGLEEAHSAGVLPRSDLVTLKEEQFCF